MARRRGRRAALSSCLLALALATGVACVAAQGGNSTADCGLPGGPCCCPLADLGRNDCCKSRDHACYKFDVATLDPKGICMPEDAPPGCGAEGGPCCISSRANRFEVTCSAGLTCVPPRDFFYRSDRQRLRLAGAAFAKGYRDPAVVGTCKKPSEAPCNSAWGPCGVAACPGKALGCPSGFYCASYADATVGDRCMPLPDMVGTPGWPCMPNNLPNSPVVDFPAPGVRGPRSPPWCKSKNDVCFAFTGAPTLRHRSFLSVFDPALAKKSASRIWATRCITVTTPCGGIGQACCPGVSMGLVTDKALPSFGTKWQGEPCDDTQSPEGAYCNGQWTALGGPLAGKCVANTKGCNDVGNKCCIRTTADKAERYCLAGGQRAYCVFTDSTCRVCPAVASTMLDFFVCT